MEVGVEDDVEELTSFSTWPELVLKYQLLPKKEGKGSRTYFKIFVILHHTRIFGS